VHNLKVVKLVHNKMHFNCEECNKTKLGKMYEMQSHSYVRGYTPRFFKKVCENCTYMKAYGIKDYKKMKLIRSLDK